MNELKWNWAYRPYLDPPENQKESALKAGYIKVVNKNDADKTITHQRYKRCLAMADLCTARAAVYYGTHWDDRKYDYYSKWHDRWLIIANKFEEKK